jgi:hypothetical protein
MNRTGLVIASIALAVAGAHGAAAQDARMSFFITSAGPGKGADLGGLAGADRHCQTLAAAVGAGGKTWRAYLSTDGTGGTKKINARSRIGRGPWYNAKGVMIARNLADLHNPAKNKISKAMGLTEKGMQVNGRGDSPNMHDILTGSDARGMVVAGKTCGNWTSSNASGSAIVGHADRRGLRDDAPSKSWNSAHPSRGCGQDNLRSTGGNGFFYCFAVR